MTVSIRERRVWAIVPGGGPRRAFRIVSRATSSAAAASPTAATSTASRAERDASSQPKQYAALRGTTVIEWSLRAMLAEPRIHAVIVALAPDDSHWVSVASRLKSSKLHTTLGGATRQETVLRGLEVPRRACRSARDSGCWCTMRRVSCLSPRGSRAIARRAGDAGEPVRCWRRRSWTPSSARLPRGRRDRGSRGPLARARLRQIFCWTSCARLFSDAGPAQESPSPTRRRQSSDAAAGRRWWRARHST